MIFCQIKNITYNIGADICGIAPQSRFLNAPKGFKPTDIYRECKSVLVFAKRVPVSLLNAESCIPYSHINSTVMIEVDRLTYELSLILQDKGIKSVTIPTDDPYEYWEPENSYGRAILSLRHAGFLAGLGYLGKNTLLINEKYGSMIQIGALLLDIEMEGDDIVDQSCSENCNLCINSCSVNALNTITVNQKKCRSASFYKNKKGYVLKKCFMCRKICPRHNGYL